MIDFFSNYSCTFVLAKDGCDSCGVQLLLRPFYVFPCGHRFHSDCLVAALTPMLPLERQTRLAELQHQLTQFQQQQQQQQPLAIADTASTSTSLTSKEQLKADVDDLVASECLYCGELMIEWVFHTIIACRELIWLSSTLNISSSLFPDYSLW